MAFQWYMRKIGGNPTIPADYAPIGLTPPNCPGNTYICAIFADEGEVPSQPEIDEDLQQQMILALSTPADQPRVILSSRY